jgi:hypothetical protein
MPSWGSIEDDLAILWQRAEDTIGKIFKKMAIVFFYWPETECSS